MNKSLTPGISFILRVKNEENCIEECIRSLRDMALPYEIIVILNQCTDNTVDIIREETYHNHNIKIHHYDVPISRAGYENLCTDAKSRHSLTYYWNLGAMLSKHWWRFDWDADFIMTKPIKQFIEGQHWDKSPVPAGKRFYAVDEDGVLHGQEYLFSHHLYADKYWFWHLKQTATPMYSEDTWLAIFHRSSLDEMKSYWREPAWFDIDESSEEAEIIKQRLAVVNSLLGPEIVGQARASNQESIGLLTNAMAHEYELNNLGIIPVGGWFA